MRILLKHKLRSIFYSPEYHIFSFIFLAVCGLIFSGSFFLLARADMAYLKETLPFILMFFIAAVNAKGLNLGIGNYGHDAIFSLPVTEKDIIFSQWLAVFLASSAAFSFFVFYFIAVYALGNPDPGETAGFLTAFFLCSAFFSSVSVYFSSCFSTQPYSYAYSSVFLLLFFLLESAAQLLPQKIASNLSFLWPYPRLENMMLGMLDVSDIIYFISFTFLFLFLAEEKLKKERNPGNGFYAVKNISAVLLSVSLPLIFSIAPLSMDLTENKIYSLSQASKEASKRLKNNFLIEFYRSDELAPELETQAVHIERLLKKFASFSQKIKFEKIVVSSQEQKDRAILNSISPVRLEIISNDRLEEKEIFLGVSFKHLDRKKSIAFLPDASFLEYELVSAAFSMTAEKKKKLIFLKDCGLDFKDLPPYIKENLANLYEIRTLRPTELEKENRESVLLVWGPQKPIDEKELASIEAFLVSGGRAVIALDVKKPDATMSRALDNYCGLERFFEVNGAKIENFTILDQDCERIRTVSDSGPGYTYYPAYPLIKNINQSHPVLKSIKLFSLPFCSPVSISQRPGIKIEILASSSQSSWIKSSHKYHSISPFSQEMKKNPDDRNGPFAAAVSMEGRFGPDPYLEKKYGNFFSAEKQPSAVILITSSKFLYYPSSFTLANYSVFLNFAEYISGYGYLSQLRAKSDRNRPLKQIPLEIRRALKYSVFFTPLIFCLAAAFYFLRKRKNEDALTMRRFSK